jgi:hypothetical protein
MLYIISQDGTHYGSSDITLKGKEIYQEGVVIGSYHSDKKAKEIFDHIISSHRVQNQNQTLRGVATCIYQMPKDDVVEKKVVETSKVVEAKPTETQEKKPQAKKVSK